MRVFYYKKYIFGALLGFGLLFLSSCGEGEVTGIGSSEEDGDDVLAGLSTSAACISKGTPGAPDSVDGRILTQVQTGDTSEWVEIAQYGQFSLIVRANYINIHSSAAYYGNPAWQYTGYGKTKAYSSSNVRHQINAWFNGHAGGAADNLPPNALLRGYTMQNNALKTLGTCNTDKSLANGLSLPGNAQFGAGNDVAFVLSWAESANYLSRSQFRSGLKKPDVPSQADAVANYNKISIPSGRDYGMWLRSPGDAPNTAGSLANADGPTGGRVYQMKLSEHGYVYPAVWVDSAIFDLPAAACGVSSAGARAAAATAAAESECKIEDNYVRLRTLVNMTGGAYVIPQGTTKRTYDVTINGRTKRYVEGEGTPRVDPDDKEMYLWYPDFLKDFYLWNARLVLPFPDLGEVAMAYGFTDNTLENKYATPRVRALLAMNLAGAHSKVEAEEAGKPIVFAFEGLGGDFGKGIESSTHPDGRYRAMVVVLKKGKAEMEGEVVYITTNASTLPDDPKRRQGQGNPRPINETYPPTVNEGFYAFRSDWHPSNSRGRYPALKLPGALPAMRWNGTHFVEGASVTDAINVHTTRKTGPDVSFDDSAGCQIIAANALTEKEIEDANGNKRNVQVSDYDRFAHAVGFVDEKQYVIGEDGDLKHNTENMLIRNITGIYAIDRSMASLPEAWRAAAAEAQQGPESKADNADTPRNAELSGGDTELSGVGCNTMGGPFSLSVLFALMAFSLVHRRLRNQGM